MRAVAVCAYLDGGWRLRLLGVNFLLLILGCDFASSQVLQNKEQIWHTNSIPTLAKVWPTNHDVGASGLCQRLLTIDLHSQSCAGTHILQALVSIEKADRGYSILDNGTRLNLTEVLNMLESDRRPPQEVYIRAAEWLQKALNSNALPTNSSFICPYTHAARVILRHQSSSEKSGRALFADLGSSVNVKQNHN